MNVQDNPSRSSTLRATLMALGAFAWWGFVFPCYLILLTRHVGPRTQPTVPWCAEVVAHRVIWSWIVCLGLIFSCRQGTQFLAALTDRSRRMRLAITAALISTNWVVFIVGASTERLSHTSLGYYIGPFVNVVLGMAFLGERLRPAQWFGIVLAALGVIHHTYQLGTVSWIALTVAISFGVYGLLRKQIHVSSMVGLGMECGFMLPLAIGYLAWREWASTPTVFFHSGVSTVAFLVAAGPATAIPLLWFAAATKGLRLSSLGLLQYLAPTGQLIVAITVNGEPWTRGHLITFGLIWMGVLVFAMDAQRNSRRASFS